MTSPLSTQELELRRRLGIPQEARRVLIFAESSHWDPDWLYTSEQYYAHMVQGNLDQALHELQQESRRVYSVECMFFLRMYWERRPGQRELVRQFVNNGQLRLTSSGVTTADTLIPSPEALLRDFLLGQEWLRCQGMVQEPDLAYFSDSFGSSPGLPSLLRAAGFSKTAITRIDGMYFLGFEWNNPRRYPRPGSSAELLLKQERSLDFVWRDRVGAEVLAHWNAFTYGQGDLLAHRGLSRIYLFPFAIPARSDRHIARRINSFAAKLSPLSRTPYMFCPIGFDFVAPIPGLVRLLDRYNRRHYPQTGIWAVNAGLDDYLTLVNFHREDLPVLELDPNPYWTGFYTARPALKARCHELVEKLTLAEWLAMKRGSESATPEVRQALQQAWWTAATSNHHDFITGTSPDRVVYEEQIPWLDSAGGEATRAIEQLSSGLHLAPVIKPHPPLPRWERQGSKIKITTTHFILELDEAAGGTITRAESVHTGQALLIGSGNNLIRYRVSGGLWRMGYEFRGGRWRQAGLSSTQFSKLEVHEAGHCLEVRWLNSFDGERFERAMWLYDDDPLLYFRIAGRAGRRRTILVSFFPGLETDRLVMDQPGGTVERPLEKGYSPTFWPFQHFVHIHDRTSDRGVALYQRWPGAVSLTPLGELRIVAFRNAVIERAFGILPVSGNPARGYEKEAFTFDYALEFTRHGDWETNNLPDKAYRRFHTPDKASRFELLERERRAEVIVNRPDVFLLAYKQAARGEGRIVRLYTLNAVGQPVQLHLKGQAIRQAFLCDARERDLAEVSLDHGKLELTMPGSLATLRLIT